MESPKEIAVLILKKSKKKFESDYYEMFLKEISHMPSNWSLLQKAWHLANDTLDQPNCAMCNNVCKFQSNKYWKWCSNSCMGRDPETIAKKEKTNIQKWGHKHPQSLDLVKDKQKHTMLERYGVDNYAKSPEFLSKSKSTFIKKYGVDNPSKSQEIIEKIKNKAKSRDYASIRSKQTKTYLEKYGKSHNKYFHLTDENIEKLNNIDFLIDQHINLKKSCFQIANELGCSPTPILTKILNSGHTIRRHNISSIEFEIIEHLKTFTSSIEHNTRTLIPPREIDIYLPEKKLAIEVNGVYWHSELNGKDKFYHLTKTELCSQQGIMLWHIFDHEWNNKKEIIKSKVSGIFGKHQKIAARDCKIKLVSKEEKKCFLNENHLQGNAGSNVDLGLFLDNQLISLMTFGKSRYNKNYEWELVRFCSKKHTTVQGGASKLLSFFIKNYSPKNIISYADRRWSNGNLYQHLNFKLLHSSEPNYYYFNKNNPGHIESRIKYQKHKLTSLFDCVNLLKTEWETMIENNFDRIWDCGNLVYSWNNHEN